MPGSVLGGSEADIKDLEGVSRFRGESLAWQRHKTCTRAKVAMGTPRKFTWILICLKVSQKSNFWAEL